MQYTINEKEEKLKGLISEVHVRNHAIDEMLLRMNLINCLILSVFTFFY